MLSNDSVMPRVFILTQILDADVSIPLSAIPLSASFPGRREAPKLSEPEPPVTSDDSTAKFVAK